MQLSLLGAASLLALILMRSAPAAGLPPPDLSPKDRFARAVEHLRSGRLPEAERDFTEVLRAQPRNVGAMGNLGVVYTRQERWEEATRIYRRALDLTPANPALHINLGLAYLKQEDYRAARPALERALELRPGDRQARQLLAHCRLFTGEEDRALRDLEALRGDGDPAIRYLLATAYLRTGRKAEAKAAIEGLFTSIPPAQANLLAGKAYYDSALFDEALECFEKAGALEPGSPEIALELGKTLVSLRRNGEARKSLEAVLTARPQDPEALYFLGALLTQDNEMPLGVAMLEKARALRPGFWGAWYYLGKARADSNPAAALPLLEQAAALNPNERAVHYLLARTYRKAGKLDKAKAAAARFAEIEKAEGSRGSGMK